MKSTGHKQRNGHYGVLLAGVWDTWSFDRSYTLGKEVLRSLCNVKYTTLDFLDKYANKLMYVTTVAITSISGVEIVENRAGKREDGWKESMNNAYSRSETWGKASARSQAGR